MPVIETCYLNNPQSSAHCIIMEKGAIDIVDADEKRIVTLDAREALSLVDFLSSWRGAFTQALHKIEKAYALAEEHGCTIVPMNTEGYEKYYQVLWPNGNIFTGVLREDDLLDAVQDFIRRKD